MIAEDVLSLEVCNHRFRPLAEALIKKYDELRHVDPDSIIFIMNKKSAGKSKKKVVLARTSRIPERWQEILSQLGAQPYFFMIEFYEKSIAPLDSNQMTALIYRELRKITPAGTVTNPDVHEWYQILQGLGRHWFYPDATCSDLLADDVDWKKLMGSFYEEPYPEDD